jgi:hypothetical protein
MRRAPTNLHHREVVLDDDPDQLRPDRASRYATPGKPSWRRRAPRLAGPSRSPRRRSPDSTQRESPPGPPIEVLELLARHLRQVHVHRDPLVHNVLPSTDSNRRPSSSSKRPPRRLLGLPGSRHDTCTTMNRPFGAEEQGNRHDRRERRTGEP